MHSLNTHRTAADIYADIKANTDDFYADKIDSALQMERNCVLWGEAKRLGLDEAVCTLVRNSNRR